MKKPDAAPWPRMFVGDVAIDLVEQPKVLGLVEDALVGNSAPLAIAWANLDHLYHFQDQASGLSSPAADEAQSTSEMIDWIVLLDGVPLKRKANSFGYGQWPKLSGSDLTLALLVKLADQRARVGILGGSAETHTMLRARIGNGLPAFDLAGSWAPPRSQITDAAASRRIAAEIRAANIDALLVTLTKPVQEQWINAYGHLTGAKALFAFGAALDFQAGHIRRAPKLVSDAGGEWIWRLILEPKRLWRRYLLQGPPAWWNLRRSAKFIPAGVDPKSGTSPALPGQG